MAMMGSTWNGQEHGLQPGTDEDFQQFLDMNGMNNLADGLQFDFAEFQANGAPAHLMQASMQQQQRDTLDTPMTGADPAPAIISRPPPGSHAPSMHVNVTSATSHPTIPATMMPPPTPTEAIVEIDAQIQYLQQQRMQQQQRQMEEQNVAFFTRQSQMVPPTPQSLELQAGSQFFTGPDQSQQPQQPQQHAQQSQQQALYERYQQLKEQQDMSFTPLVSPAVTPLESQFPVDAQFTVPGAYFSPLTSPALHAQNDSTSVYDARLSTSGTSPIDMDLESLSTPAPAPPTSASGDLAKKARKNNAAKARKANVRQSPITKPQRKRLSTTPVMNAQVLDQLAESLEHEVISSPIIRQQRGHQRAQSHHAHITSAALLLGPSSTSTGATDSENGSVSPENLTDMPPPPIPKSRSARPSPYLHPQVHTSAPSHIIAAPTSGAPTPSVAPLSLPAGFPSPATPASLMKLASPQQKSHRTSTDGASGSLDPSAGSGSGSVGGGATATAAANEHIENFELPESLNMDFQKPSLAPLSTHNTPIIHTTASPSIDPVSARASGFQPLPSPIFAKPGATAASTAGSATQSPLLLPGNSVSSAPTPSTGVRKTPQMLPRSSGKKRASISSVQVSPALRPKISPNIKPLLPGGVSAAEDQASRLLASKSNYQNILEGNTVPGVSYPSELSTNLTSKRTSHKIAEQGRRNRINSALQEIATLLPRPPPKDKGSSDDGCDADVPNGNVNGKKDGKAGGANNNNANNTPNSKASTVELAIEYIKQLKSEVAEATRRAEEAEKKLALKENAEIVSS